MANAYFWHDKDFKDAQISFTLSIHEYLFLNFILKFEIQMYKVVNNLPSWNYIIV